MKAISLAGYDDARTKLPVQVPVRGKTKPVTVNLPRFDYIDEDTFDALMADLELLDVEQQVLAMANELVALEPGEEVETDPLLDAAKTQLEGLGVEVRRNMKKGQSHDVCVAPTEAVIETLTPVASKKPQPLRKRSRSIALTMLKHVVEPDQYTWFEDLPSGALDELLTAWRDASSVTLGESEASPTS
jgi:hypothetical protein